ncbi:hypothetical protein GGR53DRAFT_265291 [Hypoxylon sp. FL1150]|nr:hypothetical protein GGR53DRAFT_265291 [Hypoxylon sp. FL1150]
MGNFSCWISFGRGGGFKGGGGVGRKPSIDRKQIDEIPKLNFCAEGGFRLHGSRRWSSLSRGNLQIWLGNGTGAFRTVYMYCTTRDGKQVVYTYFVIRSVPYLLSPLTLFYSPPLSAASLSQIIVYILNRGKLSLKKRDGRDRGWDLCIFLVAHTQPVWSFGHPTDSFTMYLQRRSELDDGGHMRTGKGGKSKVHTLRSGYATA